MELLKNGFLWRRTSRRILVSIISFISGKPFFPQGVTVRISRNFSGQNAGDCIHGRDIGIHHLGDQFSVAGDPDIFRKNQIQVFAEVQFEFGGGNLHGISSFLFFFILNKIYIILILFFCQEVFSNIFLFLHIQYVKVHVLYVHLVLLNILYRFP